MPLKTTTAKLSSFCFPKKNIMGIFIELFHFCLLIYIYVYFKCKLVNKIVKKKSMVGNRVLIVKIGTYQGKQTQHVHISLQNSHKFRKGNEYI